MFISDFIFIIKNEPYYSVYYNVFWGLGETFQVFLDGKFKTKANDNHSLVGVSSIWFVLTCHGTEAS